ncbi:MAG: glycoside hydrolase family 88 protein [Bacteroidales bacterium]|nr:glycoside hydrolase family 88 protein [Bacteroidales bacterium]
MRKKEILLKNSNMGKEFSKKGVLLLGAILILSNISAQHLPSKDTLMKQMVTANRYFMDKWPDPGEDIVTDKVRPSNLWTRAVYYEGLMALYYINPDKAYFEYAVDWGESHDWMPTYGLLFTRDGDHQCCGQTYIELYQLEPDSVHWIAPITMCMDHIVENEDADDWSWIDAIQMAMPVFAKLGVVHQDTSYFRKMHDMYMFSKTQHGENGLYNQDEHLWYRDKDFDPPYVTPNNKSCYWSRGNGWVFAALARVLDVIPDTLNDREEYLTTFKEMAEALIAVQREDGFWNPSLVDPDHFGSKETSGTAFFTYGLAWGINNGILDSATYMPYLVKGWNAMAYEALHPDGFLGYVQGTGKQPEDGYPFTYDKPANFEDYGLGAFLLAGSETFKLAPDTGSMPAFNIKQEPVSAAIRYAVSGDNLNIRLSPNPVYDNVKLDYEVERSGELEIYILNVLGEIVNFEKKYIFTGQSDTYFYLKGMPTGMYLARIKFGTFSQTIRFFKSEYLL